MAMKMRKTIKLNNGDNGYRLDNFGPIEYNHQNVVKNN